MSKINMIKTFILNSDSHVEIDIKAGENGKTLMTIKVDSFDNTPNITQSPLLSDLVKPFLDKTIEIGLMNTNYSWKSDITNPQIAYWVSLCNAKVGYTVKWEDAECFWNKKYLRQALNRGVNEFGGVRRKDEIEACFKL